jgi:GNAT superfamily N-acetyltransferase
MLREVKENESEELLDLYQNFPDAVIPDDKQRIKKVWDSIMSDPNYHIVVAVIDDKIVASCMCVIVPNLSINLMPYAIVENVVTDREYRRQGLATACLNYARDIAGSNGCYKIMLMTGHKDEEILDFYRKAGYNDKDKTGFIQWFVDKNKLKIGQEMTHR